MATARSLLRQLVAQELGTPSWMLDLSTSGAGNVGGTTVVDASLGGMGNDRLEDWWVQIRSGTNDGEARQVSDFVSSGGTITVREAFTAQVGAGVTFELHRYSPRRLHEAINQAMRECYALRHLYVARGRAESIIVDNLLLNSDFETGTFTSWTLGGAGAAQAADPDLYWHGARSAQITAGAGAAATLSQAINASPAWANIREPGGRRFFFWAWVYATAADTARLQLTDGTDTESSSYHSGNDGWELLEVSITPGNNIGTVTAQFQVAASGVARIDAASLHVAGHPLLRYALPSDIDNVGAVSIQTDRFLRDSPYRHLPSAYITEENNARSLVLPPGLPPGHRIRMEGRIVLTAISNAESATAEDTTTEIDSPRTRLLVLKAAELVLRWEAAEAPMGERAGYVERAKEMRAYYDAEAQGQRMVPTARSPRRSW